MRLTLSISPVMCAKSRVGSIINKAL